MFRNHVICKPIYNKLFLFLVLVLLINSPAFSQQIITNGNTNTTLNTVGTTTNVTTTTTKGVNAFNSFSKFNVDTGNTVNLVVPNTSQRLINIVTNEASYINGILNSIQSGTTGTGNIYLVNPNGIVVGTVGQINVGSLTAVTPTKAFVNGFFDSPGNPNDAAVTALINGTAPVNPNATFSNAGVITGKETISTNSGTFNNTGTIQFHDIVNTNAPGYGELNITSIGDINNAGILSAEWGHGQLNITSGNDINLLDGSNIRNLFNIPGSVPGVLRIIAGRNITNPGTLTKIVSGNATLNATNGDIGSLNSPVLFDTSYNYTYQISSQSNNAFILGSNNVNPRFIEATNTANISAVNGNIESAITTDAYNGPNIKANNINLAANNGSINAMVFINNGNGSITANSKNDISLEQPVSNNTDFNINKINSTNGEVRIAFTKSVIDVNPDESNNITGRDITLFPAQYAQGLPLPDSFIGTADNDINIQLKGGAVSAMVKNGLINLRENAGDLRLGRLSNSGFLPNKEIKLNSAGSILDGSFDESPNLMADRITLLNLNSGSIGLPNDFVDISGSNGPSQVVISAQSKGFIGLSSPCTMVVDLISNAGRDDVSLKSLFGIISFANNNRADIITRGLTLNTVSSGIPNPTFGSIGILYNNPQDNPLKIDTNYNSFGGTLTAFAQGSINIQEINGDLNLNVASNAGRADVKISVPGSIINAATPGINNVYAKGIELNSTNGNLGNAMKALTVCQNYNTSGGVLNAKAIRGMINIYQPLGSLTINQLQAKDNVILYGTAGILTNTRQPVVNIIGNNITLGSKKQVGSLTNPVVVHPYETLTVNAPMKRVIKK